METLREQDWRSGDKIWVKAKGMREDSDDDDTLVKTRGACRLPVRA